MIFILYQISNLERATLVESSQMRAQLEERVSRITAELRKATQTEVHETTRRALHQNEVMTQQISALREKVNYLKNDNIQLRENLHELQLRESVLQDTVARVTARGERKTRLLEQVFIIFFYFI